jgi:predicted DNA-binding protein
MCKKIYIWVVGVLLSEETYQTFISATNKLVNSSSELIQKMIEEKDDAYLPNADPLRRVKSSQSENYQIKSHHRSHLKCRT